MNHSNYIDALNLQLLDDNEAQSYLQAAMEDSEDSYLRALIRVMVARELVLEVGKKFFLGSRLVIVRRLDISSVGLEFPPTRGIFSHPLYEIVLKLRNV